MIRKNKFYILVLISFCICTLTSKAESDPGRKEKKFDAMGTIMHHIADMHSFPILSFEKNGELVRWELPLPVITYYQGQLSFFLSNAFHHGETVVKKGEVSFVLHHEKIFVADENGALSFDKNGEPLNDRPLDLSITRNVMSMWISVMVLLILFISIARKYKTILKRPSGGQSLLEPIVLFVRDNIAFDQLGKEKAYRYLPFLLTVFFFIWINNLIGIIPFFPGGSNLSGNISFTFVLAVITFLITNINGNKSYWRHILAPPGIPFWVSIILVPIEIIGIFTKPFALMIRLFANITAGHIIMLSMASLIFILGEMGGYFMSVPVSIVLQLIMSLLELLVGFLQAFIFTLLSALFIGLATQEETSHH